MDVAVVILNYNGVAYLEKFLPSIITHSQEFEVIIADNCSTDDSVTFLKNHYPNLRLINIPFNGGYSSGYNYALQQIEAKYYVLLNSDVEVTADWISPIYKMMEADDSIAAAQPKILSYQDKNSFEYAGAGGGQLDFLGYPFCRGRIFDTLENDNGQYDDITQVFWATGACLFVRADVFHQLEGLDDDFFAHMEEIDLCWRINRLGLKVMYNGHSTVYHVGGGTLSKSNSKKTYLNFRNGLSLLYKNLKSVQLWYILPVRISLDIIAATKFILEGSAKDSWAVLKAIIHFIRLIPKNSEKRRKIQKVISSYQVPLLHKKSIVAQYFVQSKKRYKEL